MGTELDCRCDPTTPDGIFVFGEGEDFGKGIFYLG